MISQYFNLLFGLVLSPAMHAFHVCPWHTRLLGTQITNSIIEVYKIVDPKSTKKRTVDIPLKRAHQHQQPGQHGCATVVLPKNEQGSSARQSAVKIRPIQFP